MADCWSCGAERGHASFCPTCSKIQPISERTSLFDALGLQPQLALSRSDLEKAFRDISKVVHPDKFGAASSVERKLALAHTERVNTAYRSLKDPRTRAEYLMKLREGPEPGSSEAVKSPAFLMTMMERQEAIESKDEEALEEALDGLKTEMKDHLTSLERFFDEGEGSVDEARQRLDELRYLERLRERTETRLEELEG